MPAGAILRTITTLFASQVCLATALLAQTTAPTTRPGPLPHADPARVVTFAWPRIGTVHVISDHRHETRVGDGQEATKQRSFQLEFDLELSAVDPQSELRVGRRKVAVTAWNGQPVPASQRALLAPLELQTELLPDIRVGPDGRVRGTESMADFHARVEAAIAARATGALGANAADALRARFRDGDDAALALGAQKAWDEWIGRWKDLDFRELDSAEFQGEIELPTGDIVDGTFTAHHLGPAPDLDEHVRLRLEFRASGPRLDLAAMRWRQELFEIGDERFRLVSLEFREQSDCILRSSTMQPATVTTVRETTIRDGDESRTIIETTHWVFCW